MVQRWFARISRAYRPEGLSEWMALLLILIFFAVRNIPVLLYGGQVLAFTLILWSKKGLRKHYTLAWLLFILWAVMSGLWAENKDHYLKFIREISQGTALVVVFYSCCESEEKIEKYLRYIAAAAILMMIWFFLKTPRSEWSTTFNSTRVVSSSNDRFGRSIGYHPNAFGTLCAVELTAWLYQWRRTGKKTPLIFCALLMTLLLFSKSRAAMAFLGLICVGYYLLEHKSLKKALIRVLIAGAGIAAAYWIVMNVPALYKLFGYRLQGLVAFITQEGQVDASVRARNQMITSGIQIFKAHPLIGVGARNYANVAYENYGIFADVYAHSNLIEFLSDFGLVGIVLYYGPRIWCLIRLFGIRREKIYKGEGKLCAYLTAFMITTLITDVFYISFTNESLQILYTLSFAYTMMARKAPENAPGRLRIYREVRGEWA